MISSSGSHFSFLFQTIVHTRTPKMASNPFHITTIRTSKSSLNLNQTPSSLSLKKHPKSRTLRVLPRCTTQSSMSSPKPPTTKEEAVLQARTSLSSTLEKPLNSPKLTGKLRKIKQPRFRVEVPVVDDSPPSLSQLALQVFGEMPLRKKNSKIKILMLWSGGDSLRAGAEAFDSHASDIMVQNADLSSVLDEDIRTLNSADVAVFLAPEASQLAVMKAVSQSLYPKPVVIFNPRWGFEEEADLGETGGFVGSFEVVYSFTGLEVRGILSKRKGVIFKCVGEKWTVFVQEEEDQLRVVSSFKDRPSIAEVENVLYNLMAMNSPVTKSIKLLKDFVANVTGKKK